MLRLTCYVYCENKAAWTTSKCNTMRLVSVRAIDPQLMEDSSIVRDIEGIRCVSGWGDLEALNDESGGAAATVADGRDSVAAIERVERVGEGHQDATARRTEKWT